MANRDCNQKVGKHINTKQNTDTNRGRGDIGDRSSNLIKLIGAERVSRRNFKYEGTYYVTEVSIGNQSKSMTEKEKNEICKGYADLIIRKEQRIVTGKQNLESGI